MPYIESIDFDSGGVDPLFMTVRDEADGSHMLDLSNRSRVALTDDLGNAMVLDASGVHFSTENCSYDVSVSIANMLDQLSALSGHECPTGSPQKRMDDMQFSQTLYLHDQCGQPVTRSLRKYPRLSVGASDCSDTAVDERAGRWDFDCTFPGSDSGMMRCQTAVDNDVLDFLFTDPFGGVCPDLPTVVNTLAGAGRDVLSADGMRTELQNQGLDEDTQPEADESVDKYTQLWAVLQQLFAPASTANQSALQTYVTVYNAHRSLRDDVCEDLHASDMPLKLSLVAGASYIDAITTLNWAPEHARPFNLTVQDASQVACCAGGSVAEDQDEETCAYPASAVVNGTTCVCGRTKGGKAVAFEMAECDNFEGECEEDGDCEGGFLCLTGSCCGGGVCFDPFACSQNGTELVRFPS